MLIENAWKPAWLKDSNNTYKLAFVGENYEIDVLSVNQNGDALGPPTKYPLPYWLYPVSGSYVYSVTTLTWVNDTKIGFAAYRGVDFPGAFDQYAGATDLFTLDLTTGSYAKVMHVHAFNNQAAMVSAAWSPDGAKVAVVVASVGRDYRELIPLVVVVVFT